MLVRKVLVAGVAALLAIGLLSIGAAAPAAFADYPPPTDTVQPPDTSGCPYRDTPGAAVDTSENLPPGAAAPTAVPVPAAPVGGAGLGTCDFVLPAGAAALPSDISASAWMVSDLTTGQVVGGKDVHGRYRPASTLKLLLMLVIWRNVPDFSQQVVGTENDASQEGSRVGMGAGGVYTVDDLMLGLMMNSGNDCANALARVNGGYDKTVADMNAAAAELHALDTRAATVSGLDGPGQQVSAYDLALFAQADVQLPRFLEMLGTDTAFFPGFGEFPAFGMANDNQLLGNYDGALGGKTGFTDDAGNTYVGIAQRGGHMLVITMLGGTQQPRRQWMQAASLLDWGFAAVNSSLAPVGELVGNPSSAVPSSSSATSTASQTSAPTTGSGGRSTSSPAAGTPSTAAAAEDSGGSGLPWWVWLILVAGVLLGVEGLFVAARRRRRAAAAPVAVESETAPDSEAIDPDYTADRPDSPS